MDRMDSRAMEEELEVLRMEVHTAENIVEDAVEARRVMEEELRRMGMQYAEMEERHKSGRVLGAPTPDMFFSTPSPVVSGTLRDTSGAGFTPANTVADTEFTREQEVGRKEDVTSTSPNVDRPRKPNICPDRFNGRVPWNDYKAHFRACCVANAWSDEQAVVFLAASLQGQALKVLGCQPEGKKSSLKDWMLRLDQRFGPGQQADFHMMEVRHRRQGEVETLQELGTSIRELSALAYPEFSDDSRERLAKGHFMDAVKDREIREGIFRVNPTSLDDAIRAALQTESFLRTEEHRTNGKGRKFARVVAGGEDKVSLQGLHGELRATQDRMSKALGGIHAMLEDLSRSKEDYQSAVPRGRSNADYACYN